MNIVINLYDMHYEEILALGGKGIEGSTEFLADAIKNGIVLPYNRDLDMLCNSLNAWSHSKNVPKEARNVMLKAQGVINVLRG